MIERGRAYVLEVRVRSAARSARPFPLEAFDDQNIPTTLRELRRGGPVTPFGYIDHVVELPDGWESPLEVVRRVHGQRKRDRIALDLHRRGWHAIARFIERGPR